MLGGNIPRSDGEGCDMKAYLVLDFEVTDYVGFSKYVAEIPAHISRHGGHYIVRGVEPTVMEGDWKPPRLVILEFPECSNAKAFLADPDIQDLFKVRHETTISKLILVEGCT